MFPVSLTPNPNERYYVHTNNILAVTVIGLLAIMSPGPDFLIVTRNSLLHSKKVGLCTALGITLGIMWWVAASLAGISYVISRTVLLFNAIKWLGALYLIYIGLQSFRSKKGRGVKQTDSIETPKRSMTAWSAFRIGLLTNLLNPKAALFFVSFFSVILTPGTSTARNGLNGSPVRSSSCSASSWPCLGSDRITNYPLLE
jgi:threonine/homoserine/homoserine lactone efflux protein